MESTLNSGAEEVELCPFFFSFGLPSNSRLITHLTPPSGLACSSPTEGFISVSGINVGLMMREEHVFRILKIYSSDNITLNGETAN